MYSNLAAFLCLLIAVHAINAYKNYTVENSDLCSEITKRSISLGSGHQSGLLVGQKRLSDHLLDWTKDWKCSFEVKSRSKLSIFMQQGTGVFAVIQSMNLRMNPLTFECIDYVQFKSDEGFTSKKFCGQLNAAVVMDSKRLSYEAKQDFEDDDSFEDRQLSNGHRDQVSLNSFIDFTGVMSAYIVISKKALQPGETTDFRLAFTAFKHCHDMDFRKCDDDASKCIWPEFFDDGIVNCPNYDCVDEHGCKAPKPLGTEPLSIGTHILIGSGTGLLLTFAVFVCCIYLCRKYGKLCWAEDFARPVGAGQTSEEVPHRASQSNHRSDQGLEAVETATLTIATAPPFDDNKDLPPSYESLFPRPNAR